MSENKEDFVKAKLEEFDKLLKAPWVISSSKNGITISSYQLSGNAPTCWKLEGTFNTDMKWLKEQFWDPSLRKIWDDSVAHFRFIDKEYNGLPVLHYGRKPVLGGAISGREFLDFLITEETDKSIICIASSIEDSSISIEKGFIRGWNYISGFLYENVGNNTTRMCLISQNDIKGWIPTSLLNKAYAFVFMELAETVQKHIATTYKKN